MLAMRCGGAGVRVQPRVGVPPGRCGKVACASKHSSWEVCQEFGELVARHAQHTRQVLEELDPSARFEIVPGRAQEEVQLLAKGQVFEKASIHVGELRGSLPRQLRSVTSIQDSLGSESSFRASSLSCVVHPQNPFVPSLHFNYRCFAGKDTWWLGGGSDLTPSYIDPDDCACFHRALRQACDTVSTVQYQTLKEACDQYFHLPHRAECRGVGGIIFDDLTGDARDLFKFVDQCISATLQAYSHIVKRQGGRAYSLREKEWQLFRRGRYVEFNMVSDRGTQWGLQMPDLVDPENVLLATPPAATFHYRCSPPDGTWEAEAMRVFRTPRDWAATPVSSRRP